jgi:hypothetical protein
MPRAFLTHTAEEAIRIFEAFQPATVLLDYDLAPGISSEPVAHHLAAVRFTGRTVVHSENPFGWQVLGRILPTAQIVPFTLFRRKIECTWDRSSNEK